MHTHAGLLAACLQREETQRLACADSVLAGELRADLASARRRAAAAGTLSLPEQRSRREELRWLLGSHWVLGCRRYGPRRRPEDESEPVGAGPMLWGDLCDELDRLESRAALFLSLGEPSFARFELLELARRTLAALEGVPQPAPAPLAALPGFGSDLLEAADPRERRELLRQLERCTR